MKIQYPLQYEKHITQPFGTRPEYYKQFTIGGVSLKGHEGADLRAPNGTPVLACDDGMVVETVDQGSSGYGKYIKLQHPNWGESVCAHLKEFKVYQGLQVKKGQVIALSNNSGNSSAPHLHFGIRINPYNKSDGWGGYSDPEPHFSEEVVDMIEDTTKIPIGGKWGDVELQALRSILNDQERTLTDLTNRVGKLEIELDEKALLVSNLEDDLKACTSAPSAPGQPIEPKFTNRIAQLFYQLAKSIG